MKRATLRRLAVAGVIGGTVPTVVLLATTHAAAAPRTVSRASASRTARATTPVFAIYDLTSSVRATSTDGNLGEAGGFAPLDSGSASVDAALDASPSSMVLARPVEPGTAYTTVSSQVPGLASPVPVPALPTVPEANAAYPGATQKASATLAPGSTASGVAGADSVTGQATTAGSSESGFVLGATTASTTLSDTGGGHVVNAVADSYVSGLTVAGVLDIKGVSGHAAITATAGGGRTSTAGVTIGSITIAGQAVSIDDTGIHAIGQTVPLGPTLAQLTTLANTALTQAGISISLAQPIHTVGKTALGSNAAADSGGLSITVTNPDLNLPGGVSTANTVTVTLGRVQVTETDEMIVDTGTPITGSTAVTTSGTPTIPGTPAIPAVPGQVVTIGGGPTTTVTTAGAPPTTPVAQTLRIAGRKISTRAAIAALGGWQALTLGLATFAVLALRNRPEDEEEFLCPCPT